MSTVSASDWVKGISLSILASIIGGASKLAIRKSWLMEESSSQSSPDANEESPLESYVEAPAEHQQESRNENESLRRRQGSSHSITAPLDQTSAVEPFPDEVPNDRKVSSCVALFLRVMGMIGMTFLNPLCSVLAMNYASPSILAPFSGLTLVWIVVAAPIIGERPSVMQVVAASLIVLGEIVVAVFGDHTNDEGVSIQDLEQSYRYLPFILYFVALIIWMLLITFWIVNPPNPTLHRFSWGVAGGSLTGPQCFLKDALTILKAVKADENASYPWYLPVMLLLAIGTAFGGLLFLTACMKRFDATYSASMFVGSFVVSATIMAAVHYSTFAHLHSVWNLFLYPVGLLILICGVWLLLHEQQSRQSAERTQSLSNSPLNSSLPIELQEPLVSEEDDADD